MLIIADKGIILAANSVYLYENTGFNSLTAISNGVLC
jgi:hypothetical protein